VSDISNATLVAWGHRGALRAAMAAIKADRPLTLRVEGWRAGVLCKHVPRLMDPEVKFGWRDLALMLATLPFHTLYFYAEAGGRSLSLARDGEVVVIGFPRARS